MAWTCFGWTFIGASSNFQRPFAQWHVRHQALHIYHKAAIKIYLLKPNKFDTMSWQYHLVKKSFLLKFDFGLDLSWFDFACERTSHGEGNFCAPPPGKNCGGQCKQREKQNPNFDGIRGPRGRTRKAVPSAPYPMDSLNGRSPTVLKMLTAAVLPRRFFKQVFFSLLPHPKFAAA